MLKGTEGKKGVPMAHVVGADTGEYSDHRVWFIRAFLDKAPAQALADKLNAWCREHNVHDKGWNYDKYPVYDNRPHPPDDPNFAYSYTGTAYSVIDIPLGDVHKIPIH